MKLLSLRLTTLQLLHLDLRRPKIIASDDNYTFIVLLSLCCQLERLRKKLTKTNQFYMYNDKYGLNFKILDEILHLEQSKNNY